MKCIDMLNIEQTIFYFPSVSNFHSQSKYEIFVMVIIQFSIQMKTDTHNEYCAGRLALK